MACHDGEKTSEVTVRPTLPPNLNVGVRISVANLSSENRKINCKRKKKKKKITCNTLVRTVQ
jgi:hypothetical protein